jgi:riboflavin synthase
MDETRRRTNIGQLAPGDRVNLERALTLSSRLGGHLVQGHIDATGSVSSRTPESDAVLLKIAAPAAVMRYVVEKGFIAVNGISLTVVNRTADSFVVSLVEYTREHTVLSGIRIGDIVNLEADIIAKYIEQMMKPGAGGVTLDLLREQGFTI